MMKYILGKTIGFVEGVAFSSLCGLALLGVVILNSEVKKVSTTNEAFQKGVELGVDTAKDLMN